MLTVCALSAIGCVPTFTYEVEHVEYNRRLRPDFRSLDANQVDADLSFGPHPTGDGAPISPMYPVPPGGEAGYSANLMQSDCVWLGADSGSGQADHLALSWEQIWTIQFEASEDFSIAAEENIFGMCDGAHPVWRRYPQVLEDGVASDGSGLSAGVSTLYLSQSGRQLTVSDAPGLESRRVTACKPEKFGDPDDCPISGTRVYGARMERYAHASADAQANPDGTCGPRLSSAILPLPRDEISVTAIGGVLPVCALRAIYRPWRDGNLKLTTRDFPEATTDYGPQWLVVDGTRSMRRAMQRTLERLIVQRPAPLPPTTVMVERWQWRTPVSLTGDGTRARWQENFSRSVSVSAVSVERQRNGVPQPLALSSELCVKHLRQSCEVRCRAEATASGLRYPLAASHCRDSSGAAIDPWLTPTYDVRSLDPEPGYPQSAPMTWEIFPAPVLTTGEQAFLRFELKATVGSVGAALRAEYGSIDFGRVEERHGSVHSLRFFNSGTEPLQIDRLEVFGNDALAFRALATTELPLPLPVDVIPATPRSFTIRSNQRLPLFDLRQGAHTFGAFEPYYKSLNLTLYDQPIAIRHGVLTTAPYDFAGSARAESERAYPEIASSESDLVGRPIVMSAFAPIALPARLDPGNWMDVQVSGEPQRLGRHQAFLRLHATALRGPSLPSPAATVALALEGIQGLVLDALPAQLNLPVRSGGRSVFRRNFLLTNTGQTRGDVVAAAIEGPNASYFRMLSPPPLPWSLGAGEVLVVGIEANVPRCSATPVEYAATLSLSVSDGARFRLPIRSACQI